MVDTSVLFYRILFFKFFFVRSAMAVGLSLWALHVFLQGKNAKFFILIAIAVLFHKSAIFVGLLGFLSLIPTYKNIRYHIFPIVAISVLLIAVIKPEVLFSLMERV